MKDGKHTKNKVNYLTYQKGMTQEDSRLRRYETVTDTEE